jgi:biotin-(acetyl-CoA carboxylase) ligase
VSGKKVCGILIEQGCGTVVGVGLNVRQTVTDFQAAELPEAASLAHFASSTPNTTEVARELLRQLDLAFVSLLRGDLSSLETCWKGHVGLLGRRVTIECHDGVIHGLLRDLTFESVELERVGEPALALPPEKLLHLRPYQPADAAESTAQPLPATPGRGSSPLFP